VSSIPFILVAIVVAVLLGRSWARRQFSARDAFIRQYRFPRGVLFKLRQLYPALTPVQETLVADALRDYFRLCLRARRQLVSMPSRAVDALWHELILSTREYHQFCTRAFGYYLHHVPAEAMSTPTQGTVGLRRCWRLACRLEGLDPKDAGRLPRLFSVDAVLDLKDGYRYVLDCRRGVASDSGSYCASHIGCGSGCAGGDAVSDAAGADAGGDGGGSGCGGGGGD
jgi:hypothetical protein